MTAPKRFQSRDKNVVPRALATLVPGRLRRLSQRSLARPRGHTHFSVLSQNGGTR
jgi:hypothetical protein